MRAGVVIVALALGVSACGSGGGSESRSQFVARGNKICSSAQRRANAVVKPITTPSQLLSFAEHVRPIFDELAAELEGLHPPAPLASANQKLVANAKEGAAAFAALERAVRGHDDSAARAALSTLQSNKANRDAEAAGLSECAKEVS